MRLVLLETSANQPYIFGTNKLRDNIGASQLTYETGTTWVLEAVERAGGPGLLVRSPAGHVDVRATRDRLCDQPVNHSVGATRIEVVYATSGKALLLVDGPTDDIARAIISAVTRRCLTEAPGIDVMGVSRDFDWDRDPIDAAVRELHLDLDVARSSRAEGPAQRFPRVPVVAACAISGLPASDVEYEGTGSARRPYDISRVSRAKREAAGRWHARVAQLTAQVGRPLPDPDKLEAFFGELPWSAVVHCDANRLGEMFRDFSWTIRGGQPISDRNREYVSRLRRFSCAVEEATEQALVKALTAFAGSGWLPVVPVLLGGDDFTVICRGTEALPFAKSYLDAFEEATANVYLRGGAIPETTYEFDLPCLSAAAGVAITKPNFPFHSAYRLAEELTRSAKQVKHCVTAPGGRSVPASAMDYHVLFDSTCSDLGTLRGRQVANDGSALTRRPFVTTKYSAAEVRALAPDAQRWLEAHSFDDLRTRLESLQRQRRSDEPVPNSQLHALREAIFEGVGAAEARLTLIVSRYSAQFGNLLDARSGALTLFSPLPDGRQATLLLDLLETEPFWAS